MAGAVMDSPIDAVPHVRTGITYGTRGYLGSPVLSRSCCEAEPEGRNGMSEMRRHGSRARNAIFAPLSDVGRAGQVEQRLTEAIRSGVLVEGERLPSEAELAGRFGVAVVTVR